MGAILVFTLDEWRSFTQPRFAQRPEETEEDYLRALFGLDRGVEASVFYDILTDSMWLKLQSQQIKYADVSAPNRNPAQRYNFDYKMSVCLEEIPEGAQYPFVHFRKLKP